MFDWLTTELLVMYDTTTQDVLIVTGAILLAVPAP